MRTGDVIDGRFEVGRPAGAGGMGAVYRAVDRQSGRPVALKVIRGDSGSRFVREAEVLATLRHPHIVGYVAHGRDEGGQLYLAMEWLDGRTLRDVIEADGLTVGESVSAIRTVAEALGEAHRGGIVHRDVKPTNLVLAGAGMDSLSVIDFGVARRLLDELRLTRTGTTVGTPEYMAPEQVRCSKLVEPAADVFALGCVLYECLSGRPAFTGEHPIAIQAKILLGEPTPLGELCGDAPPALLEIVDALLAKDPARRPADGAAVARCLDALPPLPGGRRHPARTRDAPTVVASAARPGQVRVHCAVLASPDADTQPDAAFGDEELERRRAQLLALVEPYGGHADVLGDGSVVVSLSAAGPAGEVCARAARCALALRPILGPAEVVLTGTPRGAADLPAALDRGTRALAEASMRALFAEVVAGGRPAGIRVDPWIAEVLEELFELTHERGGAYLHAERTRP